MSRISGTRIDVALGDGTATARVVSARSVHRASVPFALPAETEGAASTIAATLQALAAGIAQSMGRPIAAPRARIALLPPHADARLIPLPPLRPQEAEAVIRRDASRYFLGDAAPRVIGVLATGFNTGGQPVLAAATPVALAEAIRAACSFAGWTLDSIVPAHTAWLAHARAEHGRSQGARVVLAVEDGAAHVIRTDNGAVTLVRRVPLTSPADAADAAGAGPGSARVFASRAEREPFVRALAGAGWNVAAGSSEPESAADAAAAGAPGSAVELAPPTLIAQRHDRRKGLAVRIAAAAVLLVVGAAVVELWGANRELEAVRARRAAIRDDVAPLLAARDSIARLGDESHRIENLEVGAPQWTRAFFDLALLLPNDTYVNVMRTTADTMVVEATGARASAALQALRRAGSLRDIRLVGPVERELEDGATATERFRFSAVLTRPVEPASVPGAPRPDPAFRTKRAT